MSDIDPPRRPGPWDASASAPTTPAPARPAPPNPRAAEAPLDKGQHPAIAIGGTLLFLGFIWFITGSWVVAVALIFGLFVHEYGHVLAMNRLGCGPARIYIIPFLGGVAKSQRLPSSEWDGVIIALAGPLFGLLATIPFFALFFVSGQPVWLLAVFVVAMLNLINLAPAPPLDGSKALGPVLAKVHPLLEKAVMLAIGCLVIVWAISNGSYIFGLFLVIALFGHLSRGLRPDFGRPLSGGESVKSIGAFSVTALACAGVALAGASLLTGDPVTGLQQLSGYFGFGR